MLVSVIIPCHNAAPWVGEALESVAAQGAEVEAVVVDDGSTDDSAARVAAGFPWARLIRTVNQGVSRARNTGLAAARGELVVFLDADDWLPPGKVAAQRAFLAESSADVAYGDYRSVTEESDRQNQGPVVAAPLAEPEVALLTGDFWRPMHAFMFRRGLIERVGGFNPAFGILADVRFLHDCALAGASFARCDGPAHPYRLHSAAQMSRRSPAAFWGEALRNAAHVEARWLAEGSLTPERRKALLRVYGNVAHVGFDIHGALFREAYAAYRRLSGGPAPQHLRRLELMHRLVGQPVASALIAAYRGLRARRRAQRAAARGV